MPRYGLTEANDDRVYWALRKLSVGEWTIAEAGDEIREAYGDESCGCM